MSTVPSTSAAPEPTTPGAWNAAFKASIILAIAGVAFAGLSLVDIVEGNIAARTIWGVLALAAGALTLLVPFVIALGRGRFLAQTPSRQRRLAIALPIACIAVIGALFLGSQFSSTVVIPYTPTLQIHCLPDGNVEMVLQHGAREMGGASSSGRSSERRPDDEFHFTAWGAGARGENRKTLVSLTGRAKQPADNGIAITAELDLAEKVRLQIEGLAKASVTIDDRTSPPPVELAAGRHALVITGNTP